MARTGVSRPQLGWPVQQTVGEPLRHLDGALAGLAVARAPSLPGRHHTDAPDRFAYFGRYQRAAEESVTICSRPRACTSTVASARTIARKYLDASSKLLLCNSWDDQEPPTRNG